MMSEDMNFEMHSKSWLAWLAAHHVKVAGMFGHFDMIPVGSNLFLPFLAILGLFPGPGFLFGHFCVNRSFPTKLGAKSTSGFL